MMIESNESLVVVKKEQDVPIYFYFEAVVGTRVV